MTGIRSFKNNPAQIGGFNARAGQNTVQPLGMTASTSGNNGMSGTMANPAALMGMETLQPGGSFQDMLDYFTQELNRILQQFTELWTLVIGAYIPPAPGGEQPAPSQPVPGGEQPVPGGDSPPAPDGGQPNPGGEEPAPSGQQPDPAEPAPSQPPAPQPSVPPSAPDDEDEQPDSDGEQPAPGEQPIVPDETGLIPPIVTGSELPVPGAGLPLPEAQEDFSAAVIDGAQIDPETGESLVDGQGNLILDTHGHQVISVLGGQVAPNQVVAISESIDTQLERLDQLSGPDISEEDLTAYIEDSSTIFMDGVSDGLEQVINSDDPNVKAVNISMGRTRVHIYSDIAAAVKGSYLDNQTGNQILVGDPNYDRNILSSNPDRYEFVPGDLTLKNIIVGDRQIDTPEDLDRAIIDYVDQTLDNSTVVQDRMERYRELTQEAAENGINVVVAAGNDHLLEDQYWANFNLPQGSDTNFLAQSEHVISVGASDPNSFVIDGTDPQLAVFSSYGDGTFNPVVSAPGQDILVTGPNGEQEFVNGTSFAAPEVTEAVVRMLEVNPDLTHEEIKSVLRLTASNTAAAEEAEGAGLLNMDSAIRLAAYPRLKELLDALRLEPSLTIPAQQAASHGDFAALDQLINNQSVPAAPL